MFQIQKKDPDPELSFSDPDPILLSKDPVDPKIPDPEHSDPGSPNLFSIPICLVVFTLSIFIWILQDIIL